MSFWLNTKRIARYGLIGFIRNGFVSFSAILMLSITLLVMAGLLIASAALSATLQSLTDKVDVNVYFATNATEEQILDVKHRLETLPEVSGVVYTDREDALAEFRLRHQNDQLTLQALDEVGENPLGASLAVRAKDTSQYQGIAKYVETIQTSSAGGGPAITKVNFTQNKDAIDRLSHIIAAARTAGLATAIIFILASLLISFNTIRLVMYIARDEIGVMNLVGAGKWYVRGPFMIAGVLYGVIAGVITMIALYPLTLWMSPGSQKLFAGTFDTFDYYFSGFPLLFVAVVGTGIVLGALSSYLAVHRYLHS